jgi:hypothetical protein
VVHDQLLPLVFVHEYHDEPAATSLIFTLVAAALSVNVTVSRFVGVVLFIA